jgi:hypothetical protein
VKNMKTAASVKKRAARVLVAGLLLLATPLLPAPCRDAHAQGTGGGHAGGMSGMAGMGGHAGGFGGHSGGQPGFGGHHGFAGGHVHRSGRFAGPPGFVGHPGFYCDDHGRGFIFVGPSFYWWPSYPVENAPEGYWYYCQSLDLYYPYTESCPEPWVPVPPG